MLIGHGLTGLTGPTGGLAGCGASTGLSLAGLGDDPPPPPPPDPPPPPPAPHHHSQWWDWDRPRDWWPQGVVYRVVESQQTGFPYGMVALGVAALALIMSTRK
jgi:hypothetical protein